MTERFVPHYVVPPSVPGANYHDGLLQIRSAKAADWAAASPVLADGEMVLVKDDTSGVVVGAKFGDGVTGWSLLTLQPFGGGAYAPPSGSPNYDAAGSAAALALVLGGL